MKIIEGMKELKLIQKKMDQNCAKITQYCTITSSEKPIFETEKAQQEEVDALIQANEDFVQQYLEIKGQIEVTNMKTKVPLGGKEYTISQLLTMKRTLSGPARKTYLCLNDNGLANRVVVQRNADTTAQTEITIKRFWDEKKKNEKVQALDDMVERIDPTLEVINATTDLLKVA